MAEYVLSCCSTSDLSMDHYKERNISYVCFHYQIDGVEYPDDFGNSMDFKTFYGKMAAGSSTKTSQINVDEFVNYFRPYLEAGKDILHVTLSSGISGVVNSALLAKEILEDEFPERKIYVVDSLGASSGYGLLMDNLADRRDKGYTIEQLYEYANVRKYDVHHWFFSTDLKFYVRGGRISKAAGFFGTALKICPLLNMDELGRLIPREKIRTKKKVINTIVDRMEQNAEGGLYYAGKCYISHSDCYEDARAVADLVEARFIHLKGPVEIYNIGTTIGSHTGPGTCALFFFGKSRLDASEVHSEDDIIKTKPQQEEKSVEADGADEAVLKVIEDNKQ